MQRISFLFTLCLVVFSGPLQASEARDYCNEMYPPESYEAEDRSFYIQECLDAYGYEETEAPSGVEEAEVQEDEYYDGTVEEFVESIPEEDSTTY